MTMMEDFLLGLWMLRKFKRKDKNCYYDFSHIMDVVKVWCGKNISDDDYIFLKSYIVPNVPVVKYDGESK